MTQGQKTALYHNDSHEFLGYVVKTHGGWQAQTIFGYPMVRTESEQEAMEFVRTSGLSYLDGVWQYYDKDEGQWFPCVLREAFEDRVIIIRTNKLGYQDPDSYKYVTIKDPSENNLVKES